MSLLAELKRRNVIRMAGLYLVGAWLIVQVTGTVSPMLGAPEWVGRTVLALLAIGFPLALVVAWVFELTPAGLKRDGDVEPRESIAPQTARRMDRMIIVVLMLALGYFAVDKFVLAPARDVSRTPLGQAEPAVDANTPSQTQNGASQTSSSSVIDSKSIAVLAFANMSADKDNEYFSDGVAEEILNALAKIDDLKVAGRTSSFYFKGRDETLAAIGSTLGVAHVLEGSVRKQDERLRISAKLLRVSDGVEVWSDTFDGTDADIFALQESIARRVTSRLKVALNAGQSGRLVEVGTTDPDAYALYLRAADIFNRRDLEHYGEAIAGLQQALDLDPSFARAASRLAMLHALQAQLEPARVELVREFASKASALDPRLAEPHVALGLVAEGQRHYLEARGHFTRALELTPDDAEARFRLGRLLLLLGYLKDGTDWLDRALLVEPLHPNAIWRRALRSIELGDVAAAERAFERTRELGLSWANQVPSILATERGDFATARTEALGVFNPSTLPGCEVIDPAKWGVIVTGVHGGNDAERAAARAELERCLANDPKPVAGTLVWYLLELGDAERALSVFARAPTAADVQLLNQIWRSRWASVRATPLFTAFVRDAGMTAYWDQYGPPDLCRKDANGDYRCE
jgi:TolB-like protein/Tfp pilus assembly protein PilF